jgi:hypothetical protein
MEVKLKGYPEIDSKYVRWLIIACSSTNCLGTNGSLAVNFKSASAAVFSVIMD